MPTPDRSAGQAAGLRAMTRPRPVKVVAVTSGKGGVGKTNVATNLAMALAAQGLKSMLMDADLGLANVDVLLGLQPQYNLAHVLDGQCSLEQILLEAPLGLTVVPASSGTSRMASLTPREHAGLIQAFSALDRQLDVLLVDTAAGIADSVVRFSQAAQQVLVVVCDEPASIGDAYALIKVLSREHGIRRFHILANMTRTVAQGRELYFKLSRVADRFLEVSLDFMGAVPFDDYLRKAVQQQRAVVEAYPSSWSALAFKNLAEKAAKWPLPDGPRGHIEFFVERLAGAGTDEPGEA